MIFCCLFVVILYILVEMLEFDLILFCSLNYFCQHVKGKNLVLGLNCSYIFVVVKCWQIWFRRKILFDIILFTGIFDYSRLPVTD